MRVTMNPFLKKLGFSSGDRVAIVHADDIGAYQASLPAIENLFEAGLVSSCNDTSETTLAPIKQHPPDLVLLDLHIPGSLLKILSLATLALHHG